jgi:hypothetical protein
MNDESSSSTSTSGNGTRIKGEEQVEVAGGFVVVKRSDDPRADVLFISPTETKVVQTQHGFFHTFLPHDLGHVFSGGGGMLLDVLSINIGC